MFNPNQIIHHDIYNHFIHSIIKSKIRFDRVIMMNKIHFGTHVHNECFAMRKFTYHFCVVNFFLIERVSEPNRALFINTSNTYTEFAKRKI